MRGIYLKQPLNILSCAVEGRPGRSAYDTAVAGGYGGSPEDFAALLGSLPARMEELQALAGRVDALELALKALGREGEA